MDGYKMHRWGGNAAFPPVITVFSAPNYCNEYQNKGAVILLEQSKMNIKQYSEVPAPYHLPNDQDLFKWSVPFLMDKVTEIFLHIVAPKQLKNKGPIEPASPFIAVDDLKKLLNKQARLLNTTDDQRRRFNAMRLKVKAIARFVFLFRVVK
jgi:serine/threonine-protein phosphatase 2B catalytic subunit